MPASPRLPGLEKAFETVRRLRKECPWDKAQTHSSLRTYLVEESYEVLEALDAGDPLALKEELGDLLLQILLHAEIAEEQGHFTFDELSDGLAEKMIRRHPHVFGENKLGSPDEVVHAWEKTKAKEKKKDSVLEGIPPALPALQRSLKVIEKVSKMGFQWPDLKGPLDKVQEELGEFLAEVRALGDGVVTRSTEIPAEAKSHLEAELGDLFFTLSNVAYFLRLNPEDALRTMLQRFEKRFRHVEKRVKETGKAMPDLSLNELDVFWNEAKKL